MKVQLGDYRVIVVREPYICLDYVTLNGMPGTRQRSSDDANSVFKHVVALVAATLIAHEDAGQNADLMFKDFTRTIQEFMESLRTERKNNSKVIQLRRK